MSLFISDALADSAMAGSQGQGGLSMMIMPAIFIAVFYLLLWRPQAKRAKEHNEMVSGLQKGDEIITSGGMLGKVMDVSDKFLKVSLSEGCEVRLQKNSVTSVLPKGTIDSL
jgi:preprotein translocase subunit YajC